MIITFLVAMLLSGSIPTELGNPSRVSWLQESGATGACLLGDMRHWACDVDPPAEGIVVLVTDTRLAYEHFDGRGNRSGTRVRRWGRLITLTPAPPLDDFKITAWRAERSSARIQLLRLRRVEESSIDVIRVGAASAWIAGDVVDSDSFVSVDGVAVATPIAASTLAEGTPETAVLVPTTPPMSLNGRVQNVAGRDLADVEVELFEPLVRSDTSPATTRSDAAMVSHAITRSDATGGFSFDRLTPGPYFVVASDTIEGHASAKVRAVEAPIVIRLVAPIRATGRMLRNQVPVPDARVRFLPTADVFRTSVDPRDLVAAEAATANDGRFTLALPPQPTGVVQVVGPDGDSTRVPVNRLGTTGNLDLGDLSLPEPRRLRVRLLEPRLCTLSAIGPIGGLGLAVVRSTAVGGNEYWFDLPEAGEWALDADCDGESATLQPLIVVVPQEGPDSTVDVRRIK